MAADDDERREPNELRAGAATYISATNKKKHTGNNLPQRVSTLLMWGWRRAPVSRVRLDTTGEIVSLAILCQNLMEYYRTVAFPDR